MENNIENEATKEYNTSGKDNTVNQIATHAAGLLDHAEDSVSSLHDDTYTTKPPVHQIGGPTRLENAIRLLSLARDEVSAELNSFEHFGLDGEERDDELVQFEHSIIINQRKFNVEFDYLKSLIVDCIKLCELRNESCRNVSDNLNPILRAQVSKESCPNAEEDVEGATPAVDSGIYSSKTEDCAADRIREKQDYGDLPAVEELAKSFHATTLNASELAKDTSQISEEIETDKILKTHRSDEKESEFGEMGTKDRTLAEDDDGKGDVNVASIQGDVTADSSCSESLTEDETEPETSTDDENPDQTRTGHKMKIIGAPTPSTFLYEHLLKSGVEVEYHQVNSEEENGPQTSRYNYRCKVLDIEAKGEGRNRAVAKSHVSINMLSLLAERQVAGTLPPEITPFTPAQLRELEPILNAEVANSSISFLRKECGRLGEKMPSFKTLSQTGPNGRHVFTTQCTAMNFTAIGSGSNKRRARRDAANNIVNQHFKSAVEQEQGK